MRALLALGVAVSFMAVGEVWHGLGGASWCPLKEAEPFGAPVWMACVVLACAASAYARIMAARLGLASGLRGVWVWALALSAVLGLVFSALVLRPGWEAQWEMALAFCFGLLFPLSCAMLNILLAAVSWGLRARARRAAVR